MNKTINLISISIMSFFLFCTSLATAQSDTAYVQTSAQCGTCKKKLEHDLMYTKGIKAVHLDIETKKLSVIYNPSKTDIVKIRMAVSKIGYDADSVVADKKAYDLLPDCCKKGGHDH